MYGLTDFSLWTTTSVRSVSMQTTRLHALPFRSGGRCIRWAYSISTADALLTGSTARCPNDITSAKRDFYVQGLFSMNCTLCPVHAAMCHLFIHNRKIRNKTNIHKLRSVYKIRSHGGCRCTWQYPVTMPSPLTRVIIIIYPQWKASHQPSLCFVRQRQYWN